MSDQKGKDKEKGDERKAMEGWKWRGICTVGTVGLLKASRPWCERREQRHSEGGLESH